MCFNKILKCFVVGFWITYGGAQDILLAHFPGIQWTMCAAGDPIQVDQIQRKDLNSCTTSEFQIIKL